MQKKSSIKMVSFTKQLSTQAFPRTRTHINSHTFSQTHKHTHKYMSRKRNMNLPLYCMYVYICGWHYGNCYSFRYLISYPYFWIIGYLWFFSFILHCCIVFYWTDSKLQGLLYNIKTYVNSLPLPNSENTLFNHAKVSKNLVQTCRQVIKTDMYVASCN